MNASAMRAVLAAGIVWTIAGRAAALEKGPGAGPPDKDQNDPFVVKVQTEASGENGFNGTGSLVSDKGLVLTAAHVLNPPAADSKVSVQHFERISLYDAGAQKATIYFALGIRHPTYNPDAGSTDNGNDIGLVLTLNGPSAPLGTLATAGDTLANGNSVQMVGYQSSTTSFPLAGTSVLHADLGTVANATIFVYDRTKAGALLESGDSGGPSLKTFDGTKKIVGVHAFSVDTDTIKIDVDTRVAPYLDFIAGKGAGGKSVLTRLKTADDGDWNNAALWSRPVGSDPIPNANDVAILDPTTSANTTVKITIGDAGTKALEGLLTDVALTISGNGTLNVAGPTGALNGGVLTIGGDTMGTATFGYSLDNEGITTIKAKGNSTIGSALADTATDTVLFNGSAATYTVEGGMLEARKTTENFGSFTVKASGTAKLGTALPTIGKGDSTNSLTNTKSATFLVDGGEVTAPSRVLNSGTLTIQKNGKFLAAADAPRLIDGGLPLVWANSDTGKLIVTGGGTLSVKNGANNTATLNNSGTMTVSGNADGAGTANIDAVINDKTVDVKAGGVLNAALVFLNTATGELTVTGDNATAAVANVGSMDNKGTVTVNANATLNAKAFNENLKGYKQSQGKTLLNNGVITSVDANGKLEELDIQGGELIGKGKINGKVFSKGKMSPGGPAGLMTIEGDLNLLPDAELVFDIGGRSPGDFYDVINLVRDLDFIGEDVGYGVLGGKLELAFSNGFQSQVNSDDVFTILTSPFQLHGAFDNVVSGGRLPTADGYGSFLVNYSGASVVLSNFAPVPEPAAWLLASLATAGVSRIRKRKSRLCHGVRCG